MKIVSYMLGLIKKEFSATQTQGFTSKHSHLASKDIDFNLISTSSEVLIKGVEAPCSPCGFVGLDLFVAMICTGRGCRR